MRAIAATVALVLVVACAPTAPTHSPSVAAPAPTSTPAIGGAGGAYDFGSPHVVATNLAVPWGLGFLPDGDALVTERETGRVLRVRPGAAPEEVAHVAEAVPSDEGGLLGLAVAPVSVADGFVYLYYVTGTEGRIARFRPGEPVETVLGGIPATAFHTGGRVAFGPDGRLYASVGDATRSEAAPDPASLTGKILRLEADGSIPADNPDPTSPVWSRGHRNVEGLAWDGDGRLWATEFGEATFDELNLIEPGLDYGWPAFEGPGGEPGHRDPVLTWEPAEASPAGIAWAAEALYVASLRGERLWRVPLDGSGRPGTPEPVLAGRLGRLRTVELGPDGWLWVMTSNRDGRGTLRDGDDRIVRYPPRGA